MSPTMDSLRRWLLRRLPPDLARRLDFNWHYLRGQTPWDSGQSPPEVVEFITGLPPGRALDLGCGTGTNVLYLAGRGWEATGVDYVGRVIKQATARATRAALPARFLCGDVTRLEQLPLAGPFDFFLDIGCMHSLTPEGRARYATQLTRLAAPGAWYMLYASLPRPGSIGQVGLLPEEVAALFAPRFRVERQEFGEDSKRGWKRGWYWLHARAEPDG